MRLRRRLLALVAGVLGLLSAAGVEGAGRTLTLVAPDGRLIAATWFEAAGAPAPALVLVPMLGRPRDDWDDMGQRLADAGISALAIDLPGTVLPDDGAALTGWSAQVRAAMDYLVRLPEVMPDAVGILGASLGGNLAAVEAAADSRVRALALVSPSLDYRGVRIEAAMRQYGARPAFLAASLKDPYAVRSARELATNAPGPRELYLGEAAAHGTLLLAGEPDLMRVLVEWFRHTLTVN